MDELHVDVFGTGDPAIFVHGSFGWGLDTFPEQRALSDEYRIILVDRRGFAGSSSLEAMGWPADMHDVAALLDDVGPAHLVGQSYGAVVALLAAGLRPQLVRSLVAIEPPAFEVAQGDPDADATTASLKPVFRRAAEMTADEFVAEWARANGMPERVILFKYVLKNSLIATVSVFGFIVGYSLGGSVVIETVFDWPGVGLYAVHSAIALDFQPVMGVTLLIGLLFLVVNLATDLTYGVLDPRIRYG